jgi:hypothetical protein
LSRHDLAVPVKSDADTVHEKSKASNAVTGSPHVMRLRDEENGFRNCLLTGRATKKFNINTTHQT